MTNQGAVGPPPLRVAAGYFGTALVFLVAGAAGLVWTAPAFAAGRFLEPGPVAVAHLFTLGWITLSMVAALHHFLPVALHVPLTPARSALAQLAVFALGLVLFVTGKLANSSEMLVLGASLLALALLWFGVRLAMAAVRVRPANRTARALLAAALFLVITILLGAALALNAQTGWLGPRRPELLALHAHVAIGGWVLLVVIAVGQRLLPMFLMTHAPAARPSALALLLVGAGTLALLLFSTFAALWRVWLPLALTGLGIALFLWQVARVYRSPGVAELDPGMRLAGAGLVFLAIALVLAPFGLRLGWAEPQRLALYVGATIVGALALLVSGHYYRIVPFLVWAHRYGPQPAIPPSRLYDRDTAAVAVAGHALGAAFLLAGIGRGAEDVARAGALLMAGGAVLLAGQMVRVLLSRPQPVASRGGVAAR